MFEVYSRERPARPLVAIVASGLLLLGVVAAAAIVSRQRRNVVLSPPIHPGGWAVTFRAPQDWQRGVASEGDEQAIRFYDPSEPAAHRFLTVRRWARPGSDDPKRIAMGILYVDSPGARSPNATWEDLPLGVLPGGRATLVISGARRLPHSVVLHVGVVSARDAYSLKLDSQAPLGARDLAILNLMADSFQWTPDRSVVLNADGSSRLGTAPHAAAERQQSKAHGASRGGGMRSGFPAPAGAKELERRVSAVVPSPLPGLYAIGACPPTADAVGFILTPPSGAES